MITQNIIKTASFNPTLINAPSAWLGHLPFASWIINESSPKIFVELGTHYGHSYFSFCQSVAENNLPTKCYAIDTWEGDEHAGKYNSDIFSTVNTHNQEKYSSFSRLLRMTFDDAALYFSDASIDLLHIDGLHTYEAVRHDFETWLPKLAPGAIVLFHDTNVRERNFGVWKLWSELQTQYHNNIEFIHSHGLGVMQLNDASSAKKLPFLEMDSNERQAYISYFSALGARQAERVEFESLKQHAVSLEHALRGSQQRANTFEKNVDENIQKINFLEKSTDEQIRTITIVKEKLKNSKIEIIEKDNEIFRLQTAIVEISEINTHVNQLIIERENSIREIYKSTSWTITKPVRTLKHIIATNSPRNSSEKSLLLQKIKHIKLILNLLPKASRYTGSISGTLRKTLAIYKREGINGVKRRIIYLHEKLHPNLKEPEFFTRDIESPGLELNSAHSEDNFQVIRSKISELSKQPLISILVPTYNPKPEWLEKTIVSVREQIYQNWELCIADDASTDPEIRPILERHANQESRIKVVFRSQNGNISAASNSALEISTGEYLALLDHDDELTTDALYWNAKEISDYPNVDVIYSDEDKISPEGLRTDTFFKPDWSPELMFNCMYMGHLTVYKKSLINQVGGFRSEFDFSQDYDLALRATEVAVEIRHIPRILYHWRQAEGSAAQGGKPYARASNLAALQAAVDRRGIDAQVIGLPTANRVKLKGWQPKVSIVIPTDSETNLTTCLNALVAKTAYPSWEVIVVTNSGLVERFNGKYNKLQLEFCRYDKPYNFSDKCNAGAFQSSGEIVVFFNDDVRPLNSEWLEDLIELIAIPGVGAVSPKLIYEDHTIQHAGLVTGVRGLVGTAFHCLPENSTEYFCFAQSVRNVSALSGACFAMRKEVFIRIDGFDAVNTPIMHSDVDISFKVREAGLRCVYTPHATLLHIGHQSLSDFDKKQPKNHQDKADIFLLKRWGSYISYDPYFTDNMRALLYRDSPESIGIFGKNRLDISKNKPDVLIITHDMSASGAPMVAYQAAKNLLAAGAFPVIASPVDGSMRAMFTALDIPVIVDSLLLTRHDSVIKLAKNFDCILANTIASWPIVYQLLEFSVPLMWYLHESELITDMAKDNSLLLTALHGSRNIFAGSERSASFCKKYNDSIRILTYGVPDIYEESSSSNSAKENLIFSIFGSIEHRKGQDIFLESIKKIDEITRKKATFNIIGRPLNEKLLTNLKNMSKDFENVIFYNEVNHSEYLKLIKKTDIVVCASRDDTLPLVTLDALSLGKLLICTDKTGTSNFMTDGYDGFIVPSENPSALADIFIKIINNPESISEIKIEARQTFLRNFDLNKFSVNLAKEIFDLSGFKQ